MSRVRSVGVHGVIAYLALASIACAQEYTGVDAFADGPQDLPGHTKGQRGRISEESADEGAVAEGEGPAEREREWFGGLSWWEWTRATGDWGGTRTRLEQYGITLEGSYTFEWSSVWDGGVSDRASTRSLLDINISIDLETLVGLDGASVFVDYYSTDGRGGSADAGDFQGFSNIETGENRDEIAEIWYQQSLFNGVLRAKFGKFDANAEFAFADAAGEFLNSSAGLSPTLIALPTYPDPAFGGALFVSPSDRTYIGGGFFDGSATVDGVRTGNLGPSELFRDKLSDDYFVIGEGGVLWKGPGSLGEGRLAGGVWHHTGDFETFQGGVEDGTEGFYLVLEQDLTSPENDVGRLRVFSKYGWADPDVSEAHHHIDCGLVVEGITETRDSDAAGVYVSFVLFSDQAGMSDDCETVLEAFYLLQLTPWASVKPDIQYIVNPSGDGMTDDAFVASLRLSIAL